MSQSTTRPGIVGGPRAWLAREQRKLSDWEYRLGDAEVAELVDAARRLDRSGSHPIDFADVTVESFPLSATAATLRSVLEELLEGRGFALIRGVPVDELSVREAELLMWGVGLHLGVPIPQNAAGDLMVHVRDRGRRFSDPTVRAYETSESLEYHTDSGDIAGLLCLKPAKSGGVSTIASATAIHDEMVRRRPDLAQLLYEPWSRVTLLEKRIRRRAICERLGGRLYFGYGRMYLERASSESSEIPPLTGAQVAALDLVDELANHPDFRLDMHFSPGDIQFLNNYAILHARTGYDDWPEPERKRDLCRLWIVREDMVLPPGFQAHGIVARTVAFSPRDDSTPSPN